MSQKNISLDSEHPPSYESLHSPNPQTFVSEKSAIEVNHSPTTDLEYEDWVHHNHPSYVSIWSRRFGTRTPSHVNVSFGVSRDEKATTPDIYFTCNFQPRRSDNAYRDKERIKRACCTVAAFTQLHRGSGRHYCECDWNMFQDSKHMCLANPKGWWRFYKWLQAAKARRAIRTHDRFCSCGCFEGG